VGSISSSRSSTPSAYCEELDAEETSAEEATAKRRRLVELGEALIEAGNILKAQALLADNMWMDNILDRHGGAGLAHEVVGFVEDIRHVENGRKRLPTWPRNRTEARIS